MPLLIWGGSALLSSLGIAGWGSSKAIHEVKGIMKWVALLGILYMLYRYSDVIKGVFK